MHSEDHSFQASFVCPELLHSLAGHDKPNQFELGYSVQNGNSVWSQSFQRKVPNTQEHPTLKKSHRKTRKPTKEENWEENSHTINCPSEHKPELTFGFLVKIARTSLHLLLLYINVFVFKDWCLIGTGIYLIIICKLNRDIWVWF